MYKNCTIDYSRSNGGDDNVQSYIGKYLLFVSEIKLFALIVNLGLFFNARMIVEIVELIFFFYMTIPSSTIFV